MGRPSAPPSGTISNLHKTLRTALLVDGLLARTGLTWEQIQESVSARYEVGTAPSKAVVRLYFRLEVVPTVEVIRGRPPWVAMVGMCYPFAADLYFTPLIDLLFERHNSSGKAAFDRAFFPKSWLERAKTEDPKGEYVQMRFLNILALKARREEALEHAEHPLRMVHLTLLRTDHSVSAVLFDVWRSGLFRRTRPIEQELADLGKIRSLDSLAAVYGLCLEASELVDRNRFEAARSKLTERLKWIDALPECRRVAPILKDVIDQAVRRLFLLTYSVPRVLKMAVPDGWQSPGPSLELIDELQPHAKARNPSKASSGDETLATIPRDRSGTTPSVPNLGPVQDNFHSYIDKGVDPKAILQEVERNLQSPQPQRLDDDTLKVISAGPDNAARPTTRRRFLVLIQKARLADPKITEWHQGSQLVLQRGTRVVLVIPKENSIWLVFLTYDFLAGDPVTDRAMLLMPWIQAARDYVIKDRDIHLAVRNICRHVGIRTYKSRTRASVK
ncbi:MAG: hypothetical protein WCH35_10995 [Comamonadaceae bacterium]